MSKTIKNVRNDDQTIYVPRITRSERRSERRKNKTQWSKFSDHMNERW